jgi:hypothetical protein
MSKTVTVIVSPNGGTKIETFGFEGASCQDATRDLERALGGKADETLKSEYYAQTNNEQTELLQ